jgi:hypothetical protein
LFNLAGDLFELNYNQGICLFVQDGELRNFPWPQKASPEHLNVSLTDIEENIQELEETVTILRG